MSRTVGAKCPECGARLKVDPEQPEAKCEYCGTVAEIQRRGRGKRSKAPPESHPETHKAVIQISSYARWSWVLYIIIPIVFAVIPGIISMFTAFSSVGDITKQLNPAGGAIQAIVEHMQWVGSSQPMLLDITGDGIADPVGRVRFLESGNSADHLAAFNATNGERLWVSGPITDSSQSYHARIALAGDKVLVADPMGTLSAYSPFNGQVVWKASLGERVERICGAGQGFARIETTDKRSLNAALSTGQVTPAGAAKKDDPCTGVWPDKPGLTPSVRLDGRPFYGGDPLPKIEGMRVERVVRDLVGQTRVALGQRRPGTAVPTAAAFVAKESKKSKKRRRSRQTTPAKILWLSSVPAVNPLTVKEDSPETATIAVGRVIIPYAMSGSKGGQRLACLDAASGRSLWDVEIPQSDTSDVSAIVASDRQIFVSIWTYLHVFDLGTGAYRMTIGRW